MDGAPVGHGPRETGANAAASRKAVASRLTGPVARLSRKPESVKKTASAQASKMRAKPLETDLLGLPLLPFME